MQRWPLRYVSVGCLEFTVRALLRPQIYVDMQFAVHGIRTLSLQRSLTPCCYETNTSATDPRNVPKTQEFLSAETGGTVSTLCHCVRDFGGCVRLVSTGYDAARSHFPLTNKCQSLTRHSLLRPQRLFLFFSRMTGSFLHMDCECHLPDPHLLSISDLLAAAKGV